MEDDDGVETFGNDDKEGERAVNEAADVVVPAAAAVMVVVEDDDDKAWTAKSFVFIISIQYTNDPNKPCTP